MVPPERWIVPSSEWLTPTPAASWPDTVKSGQDLALARVQVLVPFLSASNRYRAPVPGHQCRAGDLSQGMQRHGRGRSRWLLLAGDADPAGAGVGLAGPLEQAAASWPAATASATAGKHAPHDLLLLTRNGWFRGVPGQALRGDGDLL